MNDAMLGPAGPVASPEPPPAPADGVGEWLRRNLFRSATDGVVTVVSTVVIGYVLFRLGKYVFVSGRWEVVRRNLRLIMVGGYPADELWRVATVVVALSGFAGLVAGFVHRRQQRAGTAETHRSPGAYVLHLAARTWPMLIGVALLLSMTRTLGPALMVAGAVAAAALGRSVGHRLPRRSAAALVLVAVAGFAGALRFLSVPRSWDDWGGIMLNVVLAVCGITLCFPLGVLLALGRRSKLPLIRAVCVGYIELFRGVPLYVLLLLGFLALGFFTPTWLDSPGYMVRAVVVFTLFTAAYVAEIVRGGLQSLPRGQTEAGQALGLSPVRVTALIVLPQAIRNVIPALVGQFISLFKDTLLAAAAMPLFDAVAASESAVGQPAFSGQQLDAEALSFVMLLFWIGCITISRESQRLERRLGVGRR